MAKRILRHGANYKNHSGREALYQGVGNLQFFFFYLFIAFISLSISIPFHVHYFNEFLTHL